VRVAHTITHYIPGLTLHQMIIQKGSMQLVIQHTGIL